MNTSKPLTMSFKLHRRVSNSTRPGFGGFSSYEHPVECAFCSHPGGAPLRQAFPQGYSMLRPVTCDRCMDITRSARDTSARASHNHRSEWDALVSRISQVGGSENLCFQIVVFFFNTLCFFQNRRMGSDPHSDLCAQQHQQHPLRTR